MPRYYLLEEDTDGQDNETHGEDVPDDICEDDDETIWDAKDQVHSGHK